MNRRVCVYPLLNCVFVLVVIMWNLFFRLSVLQRISAFTWPKMAEFQWLESHRRMSTTLRMLCMRLPSNQILSADSSKIFSVSISSMWLFPECNECANCVTVLRSLLYIHVEMWDEIYIYILKCSIHGVVSRLKTAVLH